MAGRKTARRAAGPSGDAFVALLGSSNATMLRAIDTARRAAASDATVLLVGETGTGKRAIAAAMHAWSPRRAVPLVAVGPAALPEELLRLDPRGGTLLLEEVGELPADVQAQLMRRLGHAGDGLDARIIATTAHDLEGDVEAGRFRKDLFFHLSVVTIRVPSLRDRMEDLRALSDGIVARLAERHHRHGLQLAPDAHEALARYDWPGNVRELENTLERAVVLAQGDAITAQDLGERVTTRRPPRTTAPAPVLDGCSLHDLERRQIEHVIASAPTLGEAATQLGIDPSTLYRKRKRLRLD